MLITCLAAHPACPGFEVGDRTGARLHGPHFSLVMTPDMRRRLARGLRDMALRFEPGPDDLDLIEQDVANRWQALTDRIEAILARGQERKLLKAG